MTGGTKIALRDIGKAFAGQPVLRSVDLDVGAGEIFAILGESGCGKTTLLRILAGLETADQGRIVVDGKPWSDAATGLFVPPYKRGIGLVFQSYAIWPHMTVAQNVAYPLRPLRLGRAATAARVEEMLALVGLAGYGDRPATRLSGGQQQRVAMARALAPRPGLLLLDEPFSNLDVSLRDQMRRELRSIQRRFDLTVVLVTHDQADAFLLSDRVAVLRAGHVEQTGRPADIYLHPATDYVRGFIGRSSVVGARILGPEQGLWRVAVGDAVSLLAEAPARTDYMPSQEVSLWLRPESVELVEPDLAELRAEVVDTVFVGERIETALALAGGDLLLAYQPPGGRYVPGARVGLRIGTHPIIGHG